MLFIILGIALLLIVLIIILVKRSRANDRNIEKGKKKPTKYFRNQPPHICITQHVTEVPRPGIYPDDSKELIETIRLINSLVDQFTFIWKPFLKNGRMAFSKIKEMKTNSITKETIITLSIYDNKFNLSEERISLRYNENLFIDACNKDYENCLLYNLFSYLLFTKESQDNNYKINNEVINMLTREIISSDAIRRKALDSYLSYLNECENDNLNNSDFLSAKTEANKAKNYLKSFNPIVDGKTIEMFLEIHFRTNK